MVLILFSYISDTVLCNSYNGFGLEWLVILSEFIQDSLTGSNIFSKLLTDLDKLQN